MKTNKTATVTDIEDVSTVKWLARALEPARARVKAGPMAEAVERMRARVFGEAGAKKRQELAA